jgi:hypothetical protein
MSSSQPLLEKLEELFGNESFNPIEEELFKWFIFAYTGKGSGIKDFDTLNFEVFKDKLNILIDAVYQWHHKE